MDGSEQEKRERQREEVKKKVDESYKESVAKEKKGKESREKETAGAEAQKQTLPEVNFPMFVSSLGMQAMMSLGELENPITKKKEVNLEQTKYFIDILEMLKDKTKGNLNPEEQKALEELIYQLQMKFVEKKK